MRDYESEICSALNNIERNKGNCVVAHVLEDALHLAFIRMVYDSGPENWADLAYLVLKSQDIEYSKSYNP